MKLALVVVLLAIGAVAAFDSEADWIRVPGYLLRRIVIVFV